VDTPNAVGEGEQKGLAAELLLPFLLSPLPIPVCRALLPSGIPLSVLCLSTS